MAAAATVIARFVECGIIVTWTHAHKQKNPFMEGAYQRMAVPKGLVKQILLKGKPLLVNEIMWSLGTAAQFIRIASAMMPLYAFLHAVYFTLRSGGKTFITFLFDSVYMWVVDIPLAFVLTRYTVMNIVLIYFCCPAIEIFKCVIGFVLVKKRVWVQNMTNMGE